MPLLATLLAATMLRPNFSDAWFLKDKNGQSCASCHSPDGIELRSFTEADIRRRASRHHQGQAIETIAALIRSHPAASEENGPEVRPMQPGGALLPGPSPIERDAAFLANVKKSYPKLFLAVKTEADAIAFRDQILAIDVTSLPVGIEMNRLSEDGFHGSDHASIANWFADVPGVDSSAIESEAARYLANPSVETLAAMDKKVLASTKANDPLALLGLAKYRALMVYQHELRTGKASSFLPLENPFWQIAEFGRLYAETDASLIKAPADIAEAKMMSTTLAAQAKQLRVPWYWLGWTRDPGLVKSGLMGETVRADYFCQYLEQDGPYMAHMAFMLTRKLAEQEKNPLTPGLPWEVQYSFFLANLPLIEREPKDVQVKADFRRFVSNSFTTSLYLLEKDLVLRKRTIRKVPQLSQIKFLGQYLSAIKEPKADLVARVTKLLASTPER